MSHLVKGEGDLAPSTTPIPRPGRPTPTFANDTIPWDNSGRGRGDSGRETAKGSHLHHVEVAHHHHHHHIPPAPVHHHHLPSSHLPSSHLPPCPPCLVTSPPAQMIFVDDCARFFTDERTCHAPTASFRARAVPEREAAASPAPVSQQQVVNLDDSNSEEEKFVSGMRKMVARAELHRAQQDRRHKP